MPNELSGKIAIITGGASGIGRATVERFIEEGARVVIADIDSAKGEEAVAASGGLAAFKQTNVADADSVQTLIDFTVERFGGLHAIFNNAGIQGASQGLFADDPLQDFSQVMAVNLLGVMLGSQRAARHMAMNGGGSIINTGSIGGILPGFGVAAYRMSKAAVNHFTKCIAIEYARFGIRVNCINPGAIPTEMTIDVSGLPTDAAEKLAREASAILMKGQPLKRRASVRDISNMAVFLASERAAQLTGQAIAVDGGHSAGDSNNYMEQLIDARQRAFASQNS